MTPSYPRQPLPPLQLPGEPAQYYGLECLRYLLQTECYNVPDEGLRLAEHAARLAVCAPEILPIAVDRISRVRHEIARTLRLRAQLQAEAAAQHQETAAQLPPPELSGGSRVPRQPAPIAPAPVTYAPRPLVDLQF